MVTELTISFNSTEQLVSFAKWLEKTGANQFLESDSNDALLSCLSQSDYPDLESEEHSEDAWFEFE